MACAACDFGMLTCPSCNAQVSNQPSCSAIRWCTHRQFTMKSLNVRTERRLVRPASGNAACSTYVAGLRVLVPATGWFAMCSRID